MDIIGEHVYIESCDYWFKIIEMLQQNWALIDREPSGGCKVFFVGDTSGVFDEMIFDSVSDAEDGLRINGFRRYAEDEKVQEFIAPPNPPFHRGTHPNGPIYSSGRFWH